MAVATDEECQLLQENVRRLLARHWPAERAPALAEDPEAVLALWRQLARQGLTALLDGGAGGGLRALLIVQEELGRAACPAPIIGAAVANMALAPQATSSPQASSPPQAASARQISLLLEGLRQGEALVAFALGGCDGDPGAGGARLTGGLLSGNVAFVEGMRCATHVLLLAEPGPQTATGPQAAIIAADAAGMTVLETPGHAVPPLAQVRFAGTPAAVLEISPQLAADLGHVARLALMARALGAANRAFELALDYAKVRRQFGQPIGSFQAIGHKLADCAIRLQGARLTLAHAAACHDGGMGDWRPFAAAACAYAGPALRQVVFEAHHVFGAIGYAEEHELPRHFRRVHADAVRGGGVMRSQRQLAAYLLDEGDGRLPDYDLGAAANAFRAEVRAWLEENWNEQEQARNRSLPFADRLKARAFARRLGEKGWLGVAWPKDFGGQGRTTLEQLAYVEELFGAGAPATGISFQAQALMKFGSPGQQAKYLPGILSGEINFCLGYSEPEAGSDLASLRTSAVRDGDQWVINGQKVWTTHADWSDYIWLAARTDPDARPKHAGISMFIVPMNAPGLTIRPSMAMYGRTFCSEFFDNVRVPLDALVGKENGGWEVLAVALADERISLGGVVARIRSLFARLVAYVRASPLREDLGVRERLGAFAAELEVARQLLMESLRVAEKGGVPVKEAAMSKTYSGELMERLGELGLDILGMTAALGEGAPGSVLDGELDQLLRHSIMYVVGGGTAEIQRSMIAVRGLGLPR